MEKYLRLHVTERGARWTLAFRDRAGLLVEETNAATEKEAFRQAMRALASERIDGVVLEGGINFYDYDQARWFLRLYDED